MLVVYTSFKKSVPFLAVLKFYYKGLDVEARSGEPPSVLTLFDRVFVHENLNLQRTSPMLF